MHICIYTYIYTCIYIYTWNSYAEDYFIYSRSPQNLSLQLDLVPDFVVGRLAYDNWLVDQAVHDSAVDVIDGTATVLAMHLSGKDGNMAGHRYARVLVGLFCHINGSLLTLPHTSAKERPRTGTRPASTRCAHKSRQNCPVLTCNLLCVCVMSGGLTVANSVNRAPAKRSLRTITRTARHTFARTGHS